MIEAFDWSVAMTVSDQGDLSLGRAMMSWCGFLNQVTMRSDLVLVLIQLRDYCSLRQREVGHGSFPTSVGHPLVISQSLELRPREATGYSQRAICPLAVRFCPMALAGPIGIL